MLKFLKIIIALSFNVISAFLHFGNLSDRQEYDFPSYLLGSLMGTICGSVSIGDAA